MGRAAVIRRTGGPEVIEIEEVTVGHPGPREAKVRHEAIAVNFHDIYVRSGLYPVQDLLPLVLGTEAAGVVLEVGADVDYLQPGDRVAYACRPYGAFSDERLIEADNLVKLPDVIDARTAACVMLKGMTAEYLLHRTHKVHAGDTILVHAAAGGVGQILCQWARHLGVTVIGTAGGPEKTAIARAVGCAHVIDYKAEDFVARVKEITQGAGVPVVYDSVGRDTFFGSMECLATRGHLVNFGQSSGPIEGFAVAQLSEKSLTLSRPVLFHYISTRAELEEVAGNLFSVIGSGVVTARVGHSYPLEEAGRAQAALEQRKTVGASILLP
ncbi:quinone oxidoreductase [Limibacillus sp. MBR-115]|jgi:NADPH2:quinone reductase|uniref:quinone oxidoreductase family protein n=1 Tax=Limibacillus sp. MBR-115 TaxID=3156465 RepID=UPI003390D37B